MATATRDQHQLRAPSLDGLNRATHTVLERYSAMRLPDDAASKKSVAYRLGFHHLYLRLKQDPVGLESELARHMEDIPQASRGSKAVTLRHSDKILLDYISAVTSLRCGEILGSGQVAHASVFMISEADDTAFAAALDFMRNAEAGTTPLTP